MPAILVLFLSTTTIARGPMLTVPSMQHAPTYTLLTRMKKIIF